MTLTDIFRTIHTDKTYPTSTRAELCSGTVIRDTEINHMN